MTIQLQTRLNRATIAAGEPASLYLLVELTGQDRATADRPPLNLAAVVDRSGSMGGPKLAYTKLALAFLVDQMDSGDYLSVVTFDDQAAVLAPAQHVAQKDLLKQHIDQIEVGGMTNLSGGLLAGYKQVRGHLEDRRVNRVLLMTDGEANVGVTSPRALVEKVTAMREQGMQLSCIGVGESFQEDLLTALAAAGGGNFYYVANPDQIPPLFHQELTGLLATVAQGLVLSFAAAPGVRVTKVVGYAPQGDPGAVEVVLPDLYAAETKYIVLELACDAAFAGVHALGALTLTGTEAATGQEIVIEHALTVQVTGDRSLLSTPEDPQVLKQIYLARSAEALEAAVQAADDQDLTAGSQILAQAAAPMLDLAHSLDDPELQARAAELQARATAMNDHLYDAAERKRMKTDSFQQLRGRRQDRP